MISPLIGVPPVGLGVYGRGQRLAAPFRFSVDLVAHRSLRPDFYFVGVDGMRIGSAGIGGVIAQCDAAIAACDADGASGVIIDPETTYSQAQAIALGQWVAARGRTHRIGVTSFLSWGGLDALMAQCGGLCFGSPQLYYEQTTNDAGWSRWRHLFGGRLIPSVAGYIVGQQERAAIDRQLRGTAAAYRAHIAGMPALAPGVIVWPNWPMPQYMTDVLTARYTAPRSLALVPGALLGFGDSLPGLAFAVFFLLIATLYAWQRG